MDPSGSRRAAPMSSRFVSRLVIACLAMTGFLALADRTRSEAPKRVPDFRLKDPRDGKEYSLEGGHKAALVVFLGTQCPINNDYLPELVRLHKEYAGRGVR